MLLGVEEVEKKLTPHVLEHTRRLGQVGLDHILSHIFNIRIQCIKTKLPPQKCTNV